VADQHDPAPTTARQLHQRLTALSDETAIRHHPWCGAHPAMDDGPCGCTEGILAALIRALTAVHAPQESRSINTLSCDAHNVTKGPPAWRDEPDYDACPDCVVTPITVCSSWSCESYPCETTRAIATALGLAD